MRTARNFNRRGYVLLLTLVVLALAATALAGLSRGALARSREALRARDELQRRWGVVSCRSALLPNAGRLLSRAEEAGGRPAPAVRAQVVLAGQPFDLVFADEQAKLNVNALVFYRGKSEAEAAVRRVVRGSGGGLKPRLLAGSPRRLAAATGAGDEEEEEDEEETAAEADGLDGPQGPAEDEILLEEYRPLQSLAQVFPGVPPERLIGPPGWPGGGEDVTCWGDGRLHFRRASAEALRQICAPALNAAGAERLVAARDRSPGATLPDVMDELQLSDRVTDALEDRLADRSDCHSLWIIARSPERSWCHLAVSDDSADEGGDRVEFAW